MMRTNMLDDYIECLGESALIKAIEYGRSLSNPNRLAQVTNPLLRYLMEYTEIDGSGKLATKKNGLFDEKRMHFVLGASILKTIKNQVQDDPKYLKEVIRGLLAPNSGAYYSQLNELLVGGFYQYLGMRFKFNNNSNGLPDIDLLDEDFASDVKLFKNNKIALDSAVNDSRKEIEEAFASLEGETLTFYMRTHEIKEIRESLIKFRDSYTTGAFTAYSDDNIHVVRYDSSQEEDALKLHNIQRNLFVGIKANWPMDEAIPEFRNTVTKATAQARKASKKSLPWVLFLKDANNNAIEMTAVRIFGEFHLEFADDPEIQYVVNYTFGMKGGGQYAVAVDVFQIGSNTYGINQDKFTDYFSKLLAYKEQIS